MKTYTILQYTYVSVICKYSIDYKDIFEAVTTWYVFTMSTHIFMIIKKAFPKRT